MSLKIVLYNDTDGKIKAVPQGSGGDVDVDKVDGYNASQTPQANTIPVAKSDGKLDAGWLPSSATGVTLQQVIAMAFLFGGD